MPPAIIAIAAGWAIAGPIAAAVGFLSVAVSTVLIGIGTSVALGGVSMLLQRRPARGRLTADSAKHFQITARQAVAPRRVIYGTARAGGIYAFLHLTGTENQWLHIVIALAGHEVQDIGTGGTGDSRFMYFDGVAVPLDVSGDGYVPEAGSPYENLVYVEKRLGTAAQTAMGQAFNASDSAFLSKWTADHRLRGNACVYLRLVWDADKFPNGPPNITFDIQGAKLYDPRIPGTAYSNNAALVLADYLKNSDYGLGCQYSDPTISSDEINETLLIAAANLCDEDVALDTSPVTYENRYEINGVFDTSAKPGEIIGQLAASMAGYATYVAGQWCIYPGAWRASVATLTEDDILAPLKIRTKLSKRELFNGVKGTYVDTATWQPTEFPPVTAADVYLAEDNNERTWQDISLPFTTSVTMAQRIARIALERARRQVTVQATATLAAYQAQAPETIALTNTRMGWTAKTFELAESRLTVEEDKAGVPALVVQMTMRETDSGVFGWTSADEGEVALPSDLTLPEPLGDTNYGDTGAPPQPTFGISVPRDGTLILLSPSFGTFVNANGVQHGTYVARYHDEDSGAKTTLTVGIDGQVTTLTVASSSGFAEDEHVVIDSECLQIQTINGLTWTVLRGQLGSAAASHANGANVYRLDAEIVTATWAPGFLIGADAGSWKEIVLLAGGRIANVTLEVANAFGTNSRINNYLGMESDQGLIGSRPGLRTNRADPIAGIDCGDGLVVAGEQEITSEYAPHAGILRDVYALLAAPSTSGDVELTVTHHRMVAGVDTTIQSIAQVVSQGNYASTAASGVSLLPEQAGDWYTVNVTSAGTGAQGLEVFVRR